MIAIDRLYCLPWQGLAVDSGVPGQISGRLAISVIVYAHKHDRYAYSLKDLESMWAGVSYRGRMTFIVHEQGHALGLTEEIRRSRVLMTPVSTK